MKYFELMVISYKEIIEFVEENNCKLLTPEEEFKPGITKLMLNYICICGNNFNKSFFNFKRSPRCLNCGIEKQNNTILQKYGVSHHWKNKEIQEKRKNTWIEKYGCDNPLQNTRVREKIKETCLEKYGVDNSGKSDIVKNKIKETCLEKYGYTCSLRNKEVDKKTKETWDKKYGCSNPLKNHQIREQIKNTNIEKYGVENPFNNKEIRNKIKKTNIEKYGVEYPSQNKEIFEKQQKRSYYKKPYKFPSGKEELIQGYENLAIDELLKNYKEEEIICNIQEIPSFKYNFHNKNKVYYPDIFIPKEKKIIEVKSIYTYMKDLDKNLEKEKTVKNNGYLFEFWILDKLGYIYTQQEIENFILLKELPQN